MSYLITYDLNTPGKNYSNLENAIQACGNYAKIATTTYVVNTTDSALQIVNKLRTHIDSNDELFVSRVTLDAAQHGLNPKLVEWLNNNLS